MVLCVFSLLQPQSDSESLMAEDSPHIQLNGIMISVCLNDAGICVSEYKCVSVHLLYYFSESIPLCKD